MSPPDPTQPIPSPSERPRRARLRVRIGRTFADVLLDGEVRLHDTYRGELRLAPGIHRLEVHKPGLGRFLPRTIEVTPAGELFERDRRGKLRPITGGVVDFKVPLTPDEAAQTPGWQPD